MRTWRSINCARFQSARASARRSERYLRACAGKPHSVTRMIVHCSLYIVSNGSSGGSVTVPFKTPVTPDFLHPFRTISLPFGVVK